MLAPELRPIADVLDTLQCGALLIQRGGTLIHVNPRLCELLGHAQAALLDRNALEFCADGGCREKLTRIMVDFDRPVENELTLRRADGKAIPVVSAGRPIAGDPPLANYRIVTLIDISRQKAAEHSLQDQFREVARLGDTVLEQALELKRYSERLEEKVRERTNELHEANLDAVYMLAIASEARDADTGAHVRRIERLARELSLATGLDPGEAERIGQAAILHDVGKIHVPDAILKKPGPLTPDERREMEAHTLAGERILSDRPFFGLARQIARSHHENWDGSGYPDGLTGEAIPLAARIVHLVDVYDAVRSQRAYKPPWPEEKVRAHVRESAATMFEPRLVEAFLRMLNGDGRRMLD